jgi:hypothetical protein
LRCANTTKPRQNDLFVVVVVDVHCLLCDDKELCTHQHNSYWYETISPSLFSAHFVKRTTPGLGCFRRATCPLNDFAAGADSSSFPTANLRCDANGSIVLLNLANFSLAGTLATEVNRLTTLTSLSLNSNRLTSTIPTLSGLTRLRTLRLHGNQVSFILVSLLFCVCSSCAFFVGLVCWRRSGAAVGVADRLSYSRLARRWQLY